MDTVDKILTIIVARLIQQEYTQVLGYNKFGFVYQGDNHIVISRENGKDTKIHYRKLKAAIEAVREDTKIYSEGPSKLRQHGITHITSPLWSLLHLLTLEELRA